MSQYDDIKVTLVPLPQGTEVEGGNVVLYDGEGKFVEAHSYGNFGKN